MDELKNLVHPVVPSNMFPGVTSVFNHLAADGLCDWNFAMPAEYLREGAPGFMEEGPGAIIFGAFHPDYRRVMARRGPATGVKKYVLWTSAPYQTEASEVEVKVLEEELVPMAERGALDGILFGSRAMADAYDAVIPGRSHWFPYPVSVGRFHEPGERPMNLGMFYPAAHRKNLYAQCLAVRRAMPHMTGAKLVTNFPVPLRIARERVEVRSWMPRSVYEGVLHEIRLNLHVTVTESFGYQVVDALAMGAPSLVSNCVFQNLFESDSVGDGAPRSSILTGRVLDFEDVPGLAWMIERLLPFPEAVETLWKNQVVWLKQKAEEHFRRLNILLRSLVG